MKIAALIGMLICSALHGNSFEDALQDLYEKQPHLAPHTAEHTPSMITHSPAITHTSSKIDTKTLHMRAGMIAVIYAAVAIGTYYHSLSNPSWYHLSYYLPSSLQSARMIPQIAQIGIQALLIKTAAYYLMLAYYGDVFDAMRELKERIKNTLFI